MATFKMGDEFHIQQDVAEKLGIKKKLLMKSLYICTDQLNRTVCFWFPKFYQNNGWETKFADNSDEVILEEKLEANRFPDDKGHNRITFIKREEGGCYEFVGVFKGESIGQDRKQYIRVATEF